MTGYLVVTAAMLILMMFNFCVCGPIPKDRCKGKAPDWYLTGVVTIACAVLWPITAGAMIVYGVVLIVTVPVRIVEMIRNKRKR